MEKIEVSAERLYYPMPCFAGGATRGEGQLPHGGLVHHGKSRNRPM